MNPVLNIVKRDLGVSQVTNNAAGRGIGGSFKSCGAQNQRGCVFEVSRFGQSIAASSLPGTFDAALRGYRPALQFLR
ncbi:MAG: hypothetical protein NVS1B6_10110 [Steroidobacteraceae bacterium]